MERITLTSISVAGNKITYDYQVTAGLEKYFNLDVPFVITYVEREKQVLLEHVPEAVLAVPFVHFYFTRYQLMSSDERQPGDEQKLKISS